MFNDLTVETTGRPAAMYCKTFSPHFPLVHGLSGMGAMPMWEDDKANASFSSLHGTAMVLNRSDVRSKSATIFRRI